MKNQKYSPFKYKIEEIFDASLDPVIIHIYHEKIYRGMKKFIVVQQIKNILNNG